MKPNSSAAANAAPGRHLPTITTASAMNPRPAVMLCVNEWTNPMDKNAPPIAASIPEAITAR